ncbi:MAG: glutamine amidotransferase [Labilithrix sp.]|nr:glutamine amidotransferase [Labilithrix sp.]MCW5812332.1 glutamine amidotransferase [Labilithrix sp.]
MKVIVLRAGDAAAPVAARRGEFFSWIRREGEGAWSGDWHEHDVRDVTAPLPSPDDARAFIVTGSSSSVTERAPWMLRTEALLRELHARKVPLLGICFGHQMIGEALGGKVAKNPNGREIGTCEVTLAADADDPILAGLPRTFTANHSHVDSVVTLPPGARRLGSTSLEPNAMFALGPTTKCVQFHPEFDGDSMRGYVEARAHLIDAEGLDAKALHARAVDAPHGAATLKNFLRYVATRR